MGDGELNPNTESGLLPAVSSSSPYTITSVGILSDGSIWNASGDAWVLFDRTPDYPNNSNYPTNPEYFNTQHTAAYPPVDIYYVGLRGVMVTLTTEKCFDKFNWCGSLYMREYYTPQSILIQASNTGGVAVGDSITSLSWGTLFNDQVSYNWTAGSWQDWITWVSTTAYKYYRVLFKGWGDWENNNQVSLSALQFVEEVQPEPKLTKLILHMDGVDESQVFVDSSAAPHTVISNGEVKQDTGWYQLGTASAQFESFADYLSITDDLNWEIFNKPFTIHVWFKPVSITGEQTIFKQYCDPSTYMQCFYNHNTSTIIFEVKIQYKQRIYIKVVATLVLGAFSHIAIVGR